MCVAASPAPEMIPGVCQTGKYLLNGSVDGLSYKGYIGMGWGRAMTQLFLAGDGNEDMTEFEHSGRGLQ